MSSPAWQDLPIVAGSKYEETKKDIHLTINCIVSNEQWNIDHRSNYRTRSNYQKITERLIKKFPTLERFTDASAGIHSTTSLNTHNRIAIPPVVDMQLAGHRQGRLDGNNPYIGYKREIKFNTTVSMLWTPDQIWNKEKVPIGREWEEMV